MEKMLWYFEIMNQKKKKRKKGCDGMAWKFVIFPYYYYYYFGIKERYFGIPLFQSRRYRFCNFVSIAIVASGTDASRTQALTTWRTSKHHAIKTITRTGVKLYQFFLFKLKKYYICFSINSHAKYTWFD